jgi:Zn-dependent M32 family carboxypeptidase
LYNRFKAELEEEIFTLEDELRRVVSEKRARIQELGYREEIYRTKLEFYQDQFETGKISEGIYQELKSELEVEIEEVINRIRKQEQDMVPDSESKTTTT